MDKIKILDFDYGCGGFTSGLEKSDFFEVIYNGSINSKNKFCYNNTHIRDHFLSKNIPSDFDLVVFTPNLGQKLSRKNGSNFRKTELEGFFHFISNNDFDSLIFITQREAFKFLQTNNEIYYTIDGEPTRDIISCFLIKNGYNVENFMLDGAGFGLPQHVFYNIYWASKNSKESIKINEGFGFNKRPYRVVQNLIGDIRDESNLTWHDPNYKYKKTCSFIKQGSSARDTEEVSQRYGYVRLDPNIMTAPLSHDFYLVSSNSPSINPWYNRPLTIREGARLFGLTDDFSWDLSLLKKDVAMMIYESFPPLISKLMANKIRKII